MTVSPTNNQSLTVPIASTEVAVLPLVVTAAVAVWTWIMANIGAIAGILGSAAAVVTLGKELYKFLTRSSEEYKTLQPEQKKQVDRLSESLAAGIKNGDSTAVADALNGLASVYEAAAKSMTNAADAKLAVNTAQQLRAVATGVSNGVVSARSVKYTKDDAKVEKVEKPASEKVVQNNSGKELQDLITTVAKHLGLNKLDDKSAAEICKVLQSMNIPAATIEKAFAAYYEKVQGLSPEESATKAKGIVETADKQQQEAPSQPPMAKPEVQLAP